MPSNKKVDAANPGKLLKSVLAEDCNIKNANKLFTRAWARREHQLFAAVRCDRVDRVRRLLTAGANVQEHDEHFGRTPLHYAQSGEVAEMLIERGAKVNIGGGGSARSVSSFTPLHCAIVASDFSIELVKVLIKHGAKVNTSGDDRHWHGVTALWLAADLNRLDAAKELIAAYADVNWADDEQGSYPLHRSQTPEMTRLLCEHDALVEAGDNDGNTALHLAVIRGDVEMIKVLLEFEADITAENNEHQTPRMLAAREASLKDLLLTPEEQEQREKEKEAKRARDARLGKTTTSTTSSSSTAAAANTNNKAVPNTVAITKADVEAKRKREEAEKKKQEDAEKKKKAQEDKLRNEELQRKREAAERRKQEEEERRREQASRAKAKLIADQQARDEAAAEKVRLAAKQKQEKEKEKEEKEKQEKGKAEKEKEKEKKSDKRAVNSNVAAYIDGAQSKAHNLLLAMLGVHA